MSSARSLSIYLFVYGWLIPFNFCPFFHHLHRKCWWKWQNLFIYAVLITMNCYFFRDSRTSMKFSFQWYCFAAAVTSNENKNKKKNCAGIIEFVFLRRCLFYFNWKMPHCFVLPGGSLFLVQVLQTNIAGE